MTKQALDLKKIRQVSFSTTAYFREEHPKKQIYLHHTVGHPNPTGSINSWISGNLRVATAFLIAGTPYPTDKGHFDGEIFQCFASKYWALHLASHGAHNKIPTQFKTLENTRMLEKGAIGIEICNAGWLTYENGKFLSTFGREIPKDQVVEYSTPFRGKRFYHRYSDAQIESLRQLLRFLCDRYNINDAYQEDLWDISVNALSGKAGIFNHTSVRSDKSDCHPQPELVQMLKELYLGDEPDTTDQTTENYYTAADLKENPDLENPNSSHYQRIAGIIKDDPNNKS